jgi:uncharacterized NAD(P)/FAD-binding protein YdhS
MKMETPRRRPVVAILGGGLSGGATAFHLARALPPGAVDIVVVDPRPTLGAGLAYSTDDPAHRINVPASKMSIFSGDIGHFMAWLAAERRCLSPGTLTLRGDLFPERRIFGQYVASCLEPHLASGAIRHVRVSAVSATRVGERYLVDLSDGSSIGADFLVLAMTHPLPGLPAELRDIADSPRLVTDPYDNRRIAAIGPTERVLIMGTGLTSADVIASLCRRGFWGEFVALSRHGLRSRGHGVVARKSEVDFARYPAPTALALLQRIRSAVAADAAFGHTWHATLDRIREQGHGAWRGLSFRERGRLVRHLRPYWDVHRFRVAPQVEEVLDAQVARGKLAYVAARLVGASEAPDGIVVQYRRRGSHEVVTDHFDAVVVTTGPAHGSVLRVNPVLRALAADGQVRPDPLGLGLFTADHFRAIGASGTASSTLFVCGPLARGNVGELMGVPEVTAHAEAVAERLARQLRISRPLTEASAG